MKMRSVVGGLAAAALLYTGPALAVEATDVSKDFPDEKPPAGLDVEIGFGALQGDAGDFTSTGPLLGISAGAQIHPDLGVELGYEGQRLPFDAALVGDDEALYRHNLELTAKAGPLLAQHWRPFVATGAGLSYFNPTEGAETLFDNDLAVEVPFAAGLEYRVGKVFAGARASYSLVLGEGYADDAFPDESGGNLLDASFTLGGRF
jgi:hypothetical protein